MKSIAESPGPMDGKVVVLKVGEHLLSLPFDYVDEILSFDRAIEASDLPDGTVTEEPGKSRYVSSRGRWIGLRKLLPGQTMKERSQIIVVTCDETPRAFMVDQVAGIEKSGPLAPFPDMALPFMDIPFAGVRFLRDQLVLELDLSRLISLDRGDQGAG
jgi:chemotaxis signal transduction protein